MIRGFRLPVVTLAIFLVAAPLQAKPTEFLNVMYSLAAPMETNTMGLQIGAGWTWAGMHYGSEGSQRDTSFLAQWGLARGISDNMAILGGISLGINRNCIDSVGKQVQGRDDLPCVNENLTSAISFGGAGGFNLGLVYQISDSFGATVMYDTFDNKPDGATGLQGLVQFGLNWHP